MIRNCAILPTLCLGKFALLSKELTFIFLFAVTAAGVVPQGLGRLLVCCVLMREHTKKTMRKGTFSSWAARSAVII